MYSNRLHSEGVKNSHFFSLGLYYLSLCFLPKIYRESMIRVQESIYEVVPGSMLRKRQIRTGKGREQNRLCVKEKVTCGDNRAQS